MRSRAQLAPTDRSRAQLAPTDRSRAQLAPTDRSRAQLAPTIIDAISASRRKELLWKPLLKQALSGVEGVDAPTHEAIKHLRTLKSSRVQTRLKTHGTTSLEQFEVPNTYENYEEMLAKESLDFVSVCTWIALHRDMVIAAANSGIKAIHSEKPMAPHMGRCQGTLSSMRG